MKSVFDGTHKLSEFSSLDVGPNIMMSQSIHEIRCNDRVVSRLKDWATIMYSGNTNSYFNAKTKMFEVEKENASVYSFVEIMAIADKLDGSHNIIFDFLDGRDATDLRFQRQNKFSKDQKQGVYTRGNCFQTVIACILRVPMCNVPNMETLFQLGGDIYMGVLEKWLDNIGYCYRTADEFKCFHSPNDKWSTNESLKLKDQLYLASGSSPRGDDITHICIYKNGELYHDPHPSDDGLIEVYNLSVIEKAI